MAEMKMGMPQKRRPKETQENQEKLEDQIQNQPLSPNELEEGKKYLLAKVQLGRLYWERIKLLKKLGAGGRDESGMSFDKGQYGIVFKSDKAAPRTVSSTVGIRDLQKFRIDSPRRSPFEGKYEEPDSVYESLCRAVFPENAEALLTEMEERHDIERYLKLVLPPETRDASIRSYEKEKAWFEANPDRAPKFDR